MKLNPFKSRGKRLVLHCCYHKCMTLYFNDVFKVFCEKQGLVFLNTANSAAAPESADFVLSHDSSLDLRGLRRPWRATHMVRDPRDLLISAYFYHLRTEEEWCAKPSAANHDLPADVSYRQHLRSLDQEQGILYELRHVAGRMVQLMGEWDATKPDVLELRYEDVLGNEEFWFRRIFTWYGFGEYTVGEAVKIARRYSLERLRPGDPGHGHGHRRSQPGYWQDFFTEAVRREFKELYGEIPVKLGYEASRDW